MLIDAHLHITKEDVENKMLDMMAEKDLYGLVAGTNPEDCAWVGQLSKCEKRVIPTYGLHPWYADQYKIKDMVDYLQNCSVIGEIGMDSIWCDVDLACQRKIFLAQMDIAEERGCPVILHTKGQEKAIGEIIADYSMPVIVHWYSSEKDIDLYLKRDCYFTVGPDVWQNPSVQQLINCVSIDRLLVESDGTSAVEWAVGQSITPKELPEILTRSIAFISEIKEVEVSTINKAMEKSFKCLIGI